MRSELITINELMSPLREQGIDDVGLVKSVAVTGNGQLRVVTFEQQQTNQGDQRGRAT